MLNHQARIDAKRKKALRPTGLLTSVGQERARANSLIDGLCASAIVAEDADLIYDRSADYFKSILPQNHYHAFLVTDVAVLTIRLERCVRMERRARDKIAIRAEIFWDDDRRIEAIALGETLSSRPSMVVEQLQKTPHGCDWLMGRWAMLAYCADANNKWTDEQTQLAFDLLATPVEFRAGLHPGVSIDFEGRVTETLDLASVARREIAALKARREVVVALDEADQALAMADLSEDNDPEIQRIRRHESHAPQTAPMVHVADPTTSRPTRSRWEV